MSTSKQQSKNKHKNNTNCGSAFEPGASGLDYYCTSICLRSGCTRRANCVDSNPKKTEKNLRMVKDLVTEKIGIEVSGQAEGQRL